MNRFFHLVLVCLLWAICNGWKFPLNSSPLRSLVRTRPVAKLSQQPSLFLKKKTVILSLLNDPIGEYESDMDDNYRMLFVLSEEITSDQHVVEFIYFWAKYQTDFEHEIFKTGVKMFLSSNLESYLAIRVKQLSPAHQDSNSLQPRFAIQYRPHIPQGGTMSDSYKQTLEGTISRMLNSFVKAIEQLPQE